MFITIEDVKKLNPSKESLNWFVENFPNGGDEFNITNVDRDTNNLDFVCWYVSKVEIPYESKSVELPTMCAEIEIKFITCKHLNIEQLKRVFGNES